MRSARRCRIVLSREQKLEALLASAVRLLDEWEDISVETGEEPKDMVSREQSCKPSMMP